MFYEGHLPAFSVIAFLRRGLGRPPVDARLEKLFERGIDPETEAAAVPRSGASTVWPSRDEVRAFARACDEAVLAALRRLPPTRVALEGLYTALEHEAMHQETLLYMWHRLPYEQKRRRGRPRWLRPCVTASRPSDRAFGPRASRRGVRRQSAIPAGDRDARAPNATTSTFGWDNEFDAHASTCRRSTSTSLPVTNARVPRVRRGGRLSRPQSLWDDEGWAWIQQDASTHPAFWLPPTRTDRHRRGRWRGMFEDDAAAARRGRSTSARRRRPPTRAGRGGGCRPKRSSTAPRSGRRRVTSVASVGRGAAGRVARTFDFAAFDPVPVGSFPAGASAWGVHDLSATAGSGPRRSSRRSPGFAPMASYPEYSADFFDGQHYVMKGASPATARELVRPSFRNWFRGNYPYVYAKFRTAR